jgi:hypothetical protein
MAAETERSLAQAIEVATKATNVLLFDVTSATLPHLMQAAKRAEDVYSELRTNAAFIPDATQFATLSKKPYKKEEATFESVTLLRAALLVPRTGTHFSANQGPQGIVSTPSSALLGVGGKGCAGPNVVPPNNDDIAQAPLNVIRAGLCETTAALRAALAMCDASLLRVLEAYAFQIEKPSTPLGPDCKRVLLKLLEVFRNGFRNGALRNTPTTTEDCGFEVIAMFQAPGDVTFPYPHYQQMLRMVSEEKVANTLSDHFDEAQVHAAVREYCTAQQLYADSMAAAYTARFVPLKEALRAADSMGSESESELPASAPVLVIDIDETLVHAADSQIETDATRIQVTWVPDDSTMARYKNRLLTRECAHLKLDGPAATSTVLVSAARMAMFGRLLATGTFQSAFFASANNDGRTNALIAELCKHYPWVRTVSIIPRDKSMVGACDERDKKKSIAAIRTAVRVSDHHVVVMVDDKAKDVVGATANDALLAVRPFKGIDAELDPADETSLEREIAAPARECKRKRE